MSDKKIILKEIKKKKKQSQNTKQVGASVKNTKQAEQCELFVRQRVLAGSV